MSAIDPIDRKLLDFLCSVEADHHCIVRSVKTRLRPSLKRLRYAGLVLFDSFTPSGSAMIDWQARNDVPQSPPSPGGAAGEEQPRPKAADEDGGAVARTGSAPPNRESNVSTFELLQEIRTWLAANSECTKTNFSRLALGRAAALIEIERSGTVRPKTARRVREFIANPPTEAFNRQRGRPKGAKAPKPDKAPQFFEATEPRETRRPADRKINVHGQRVAAKVRRTTTARAMKRIEQGLDARNCTQATVKHAQIALEAEIAMKARLADPIEVAKQALRKRYVPVLNAETMDGPAGHYIVGRRTVSKDELLAMAGRMAA